MKYPTTRLVFDRKKTATKDKEALVQVEILHERKKKYVTTGVYVYKDQWNDKQHVCRREDAMALNDRINAVKKSIDGFITSLIESSTPFTFERLTTFLEMDKKREQTFIEYIAERISNRNDITLSTKKSQAKILTSLEDYGKIVTFDNLTRANVAGYYDWLMAHEITKIGRDGKEYKTTLSQQTVWSYMKTLRTYIHDAMVHERMTFDPSLGIKVRKGEYEQTKWLSEEEVEKLENAELSSGSLVRVRDLFIFGCYTGMAYSDLIDFTPEKLEKDGENTFLHGRRKKTNQEYIVLILPKAKEILEKYAYKLPRYSNQQYNKRLKDVAEEAGINRELSSHWSRRTAGMLLLNSGVRIEVVARVLGHSTIRETERVYASILKKTIVKEMEKLK